MCERERVSLLERRWGLSKETVTFLTPCVCERERECVCDSERVSESVGAQVGVVQGDRHLYHPLCVCVCVRVRVCEREKEREKRQRREEECVCVCVRVRDCMSECECVCVSE